MLDIFLRRPIKSKLAALPRNTRLKLSYLAFKLFATYMTSIGLSEEAAKTWQNYLSRSGEKIEINLEKLYNNDNYYGINLSVIIKIYTDAAKIFHRNNPDLDRFILYGKKLFPVTIAHSTNAKMILGAHLLKTKCFVSYNKNTEMYSCTIDLETQDVWDANYNKIQLFPIPKGPIPVLGFSLDLNEERIQAIVDLMDWSWDLDQTDEDDEEPRLIKVSADKNYLIVTDTSFGVFETFRMAKPFLVHGSFRKSFTFKGSNKFEKEACCPILSEYSQYNPNTNKCDCLFSDENNTHKKYQLIKNYIYPDPKKVEVSAITKDKYKYKNKKLRIITKKINENIPLISYCDCPGDLIFKFENASPAQLVNNPNKTSYLYCECPEGMIPDPQDDTKCICYNSDNEQFNKALCEDLGYQDYVENKEPNPSVKYDIFMNTNGDDFFPFDYKKMKKSGCKCICYPNFEYDESTNTCLCMKSAVFLPNTDPTIIKSQRAGSFPTTDYQSVEPLSDFDNGCNCPPFTEEKSLYFLTHCTCKKPNTYYSYDIKNCKCLPGLVLNPDSGKCECEQPELFYDYELLRCVENNNLSSSSSTSSTNLSSSSSSGSDEFLPEKVYACNFEDPRLNNAEFTYTGNDDFYGPFYTSNTDPILVLYKRYYNGNKYWTIAEWNFGFNEEAIFISLSDSNVITDQWLFTLSGVTQSTPCV